MLWEAVRFCMAVKLVACREQVYFWNFLTTCEVRLNGRSGKVNFVKTSKKRKVSPSRFHLIPFLPKLSLPSSVLCRFRALFPKVSFWLLSCVFLIGPVANLTFIIAGNPQWSDSFERLCLYDLNQKWTGLFIWAGPDVNALDRLRASSFVFWKLLGCFQLARGFGRVNIDKEI